MEDEEVARKAGRKAGSKEFNSFTNAAVVMELDNTPTDLCNRKPTAATKPLYNPYTKKKMTTYTDMPVGNHNGERPAAVAGKPTAVKTPAAGKPTAAAKPLYNPYMKKKMTTYTNVPDNNDKKPAASTSVKTPVGIHTTAAGRASFTSPDGVIEVNNSAATTYEVDTAYDDDAADLVVGPPVIRRDGQIPPTSLITSDVASKSSDVASKSSDAANESLLYSKKRWISPDIIPCPVPVYNGQSELLSVLFRFPHKTVMTSLQMMSRQSGDQKLSRRQKSFDMSELAQLTGVASSVGAQTLPLLQRQDNFTLYEATADNVNKLKAVLRNLDIRHNAVHVCTVEGCGQIAVTARVIKISNGPGTWPNTHCLKHAKLDGGEFLADPAACFCGMERHRTCVLCDACRRNKPCKYPGCTNGGNGRTCEVAQLCPTHRLRYERRVIENLRKIKRCLRCSEELLEQRGSGTRGALHNICTRQSCGTKCAYQFDDGTFCQEERQSISGTATACYCPQHWKAVTSQQKRESENRRRNGEPSTRWSQPEMDYLEKLMHPFKVAGKRSNYSVIIPTFQKRYPDRFSDAQIKKKGGQSATWARNVIIVKRERNSDGILVKRKTRDGAGGSV